MQNRPTENQIRINEIARIIDELSAELSNLLTIEENNQGRDNQDIRREIQIGDTVEITNNYREQLGERGIVTKVTEKQVSLRLESTGRIIRKKKSNVRIVPPDIDTTQQ
jgi:DNA-directed RNA polymerase beta' subunit